MSTDLTDLFQQLKELLDKEDHESAIDLCDQILAASPGDTDALKSKVVCLIELSKNEDALQVIEAAPSLETECTFEKAYCLYSLHREDEALTILAPNGERPSGERELQLAGQIAYRQGKFALAADYFQASETSAGSGSSELSVNILAALVSAGKGAEALAYAKASGYGEDSSGDATQFELHYNHACAAIATGQLPLAKRLVNTAIELCRETLSKDDDYTEEEVEVTRRPHSRAACIAPAANPPTHKKAP